MPNAVLTQQTLFAFECGWRGIGEGEDWRKVILGIIVLLVIFAIISIVGQFFMRHIFGAG